MSVRHFPESIQSNVTEKVFELSETIETPGTGDTWVFPEDCGKIYFVTFALIAAHGSCKCEISISPRDEILNGAGEWFDSWLGTITNDADMGIMPGITGIRQTNIAGISKLEVLAQ